MKKQEKVDERKRFAYAHSEELPDHEDFVEFVHTKNKQKETTSNARKYSEKMKEDALETNSSPRIPKSKAEKEQARKAEAFLKNWGV